MSGSPGQSLGVVRWAKESEWWGMQLGREGRR